MGCIMYLIFTGNGDRNSSYGLNEEIVTWVKSFFIGGKKGNILVLMNWHRTTIDNYIYYDREIDR